MRSSCPNFAIMISVLILTLGAAGDGLADEIGAASAAPDTTDLSSRAIGKGVLAGAGGFVGGFIVGAALFQDTGGEYGGLEAGLILGSVFGSLAMPLGVHHGNGSRGNGLLVVGTSLAVGAVGWTIGLTTGSEILLPLTAVAQIVACLAVEKATMPDPAPRVSFAPAAIAGKPGFVVVGRF